MNWLRAQWALYRLTRNRSWWATLCHDANYRR
jgi:hypothetical protein